MLEPMKPAPPVTRALRVAKGTSQRWRVDEAATVTNPFGSNKPRPPLAVGFECLTPSRSIRKSGVLPLRRRIARSSEHPRRSDRRKDAGAQHGLESDRTDHPAA